MAAGDRRPDSPYRAAFGDDPAGWADASPIVHAAAARSLPSDASPDSHGDGDLSNGRPGGPALPAAPAGSMAGPSRRPGRTESPHERLHHRRAGSELCPTPPFQLVIAYGPALANKKKGVDEFAATLRRAGARAEVVDAASFREHQSLMTEFGAPDDPVSKAVLEFIESVRSGATVAGLGRERVLQAEGMSADEATRTLEAYRTRVLMKQFDRNGDRRVLRDEMPEQFRLMFDRLDADRDGVVSESELAAYYRRTQPIAPPPSPAAEPPAAAATNAAFTVDDVRMGDAQSAYIDPEILQGEARMAFLDSRLDAWVGEIDPATGLFRSADGRDHRVDTGISPWSRYSNGPEWGLDANGPALFYVKDNAQGAGQLWRAEPPWDKPRLTQLTHDTDIHNWICEPSVNSAAPSTRVIVYRGKPRAAGNVNAWLDEDNPGEINPFTDRMIVARWAFNTNLITFAYRARPGQTEPSQVTLVDTDTGKARVITGDEGNKIDPWLWNAPAFGGELMLAVNVDSRTLALYRDVKRDGSPWQRIATLRLPAESPHPTPKSVEPVNGGRGAFGRSYFTVQAGDDKDPDTSIWLFGFSPDGRHLIRRLDDGAVTGAPARRLDPESLIGERHLFVYYTRTGDGPSHLHRCRALVKDRP